jgi:phosphoglycolate phosphatase
VSTTANPNDPKFFSERKRVSILNGPSRLVLFDIDGTLLHSQGIGKRAMKEALITVYGTAGSIDTCAVGGRSYRQIVEDALFGTDISQDQISQKWCTYNEEVARIMKEIVQQEPGWIYPLPGGIALVDALAHNPMVVLGIITGNSVDPSWIKLEQAGYKVDQFKVNVFGDEAITRSGLVSLARQRAAALTGISFPGQSTIIVGDTVNDVECARQADARSIIVLTGYDTQEVLKASKPDQIFKDLQDIEAIQKAIFD